MRLILIWKHVRSATRVRRRVFTQPRPITDVRWPNHCSLRATKLSEDAWPPISKDVSGLHYFDDRAAIAGALTDDRELKARSPTPKVLVA